MSESRSTEQPRNARLRFLTLLVAASVVAGGLAGVAVLQFGNYFDYPAELRTLLENPMADLTEHMSQIDQLDREFVLKNTALCGTVAGMLLAGLLGLSAGILRSVRGAVAGLVMGVILGALLGAIGGYGGGATWQYLVDNHYFENPTSDRTFHAATANTVLWAAVGLAAGAAAGFGGPIRKQMSGAIAGLSGGVLAAWLFLFVAALAFPAARIGLPIPEGLGGASEATMARMVWPALPAILIGLLSAVMTAPDRHRPSQEASRDE